MAALFSITADPKEGPAPLTVSFIFPGKSGPCYTWTFGDGEISHDMNPIHTFQTPGSYLVTLQTWEQIGETLYENEFFSTTITVTNPSPIVIAIGLTSPGNTVTCMLNEPDGSRITARKRK